jgi:hypothetical protein
VPVPLGVTRNVTDPSTGPAAPAGSTVRSSGTIDPTPTGAGTAPAAGATGPAMSSRVTVAGPSNGFACVTVVGVAAGEATSPSPPP